MNWLDIVILILVIVPALIGLKTGIIKITLSLAGMVLGVLLAGRFHAALAERLTFITQANLAEIAAYAIILIVTMIVAAVVAKVLHSLTSAVLLGWVDHLGGAALGFALGVVFCAAVLGLWVRYIGAAGPVADSALAPLLEPISLALIGRFFQN